MMTAIAVNNNFYNEFQGTRYLSKTFQSTLRLTPSDISRRTISQENFTRQKAKEDQVAKSPWGRKFSYGGVGPVNLPTDHRPKDEPPRVQKGHRHFSSGVCVNPRNVTINERYKETSLRRSNCRVTDELIGSPNKVYLGQHHLKSKYPIEHPFATHIERAGLFPTYEIPPANESANAITDLPAAAPDIDVLTKSRGAPYRHEKSASTEEWERKPVEWIEGPNFFQTQNEGVKVTQKLYPIPPKALDPNSKVCREISAETSKALKKLKEEQWTSTYNRYMTTDEVFQSKYVKPIDDQGPLTSKETEKLKSIPQRFKFIPDHKNDETTSGAENKSDEKQERSVHFEEKTNDVNDSALQTQYEGFSPKVSRVSPSYAVVQNERKPFILASYPPAKPKHDEERSDLFSAELIRGWSRSGIRRTFNERYRDKTPDLRRKPDLRITTNERRHRFPEFGNAGSYVWNGLSVPHLETRLK